MEATEGREPDALEARPAPEVMSAKLTFSQDGDSAGGESHQFLEMESVDAGGGHFFVISTERWAFDSPAELVALCERLSLAVNRTTEEERHAE